MRLTRAGEYAVRCMLFLSCLGVDKIGSRLEIAQAMDIPAQFLGKIAQQLARAGYIEADFRSDCIGVSGLGLKDFFGKVTEEELAYDGSC